MWGALQHGNRRAARSPRLVLLLPAVNLGSAALLAVPLARTLESDLEHTDAARRMMHGFDYPWWSQWSDAQHGWTSSFAPDVFGAGFAFRNVDLLLRGYLPAGLFVSRDGGPAGGGGGGGGGDGAAGVDPLILAFGAAYLVLQTFLAGGVLATLRGPRASWTLRGLLHGSGFYFGRFLRLVLLVLLMDGVVFALNAPVGRWADHRAREAVSESAAAAWLVGRYALLLLALLWVNMVSGYAKAIVVLEERKSAALALLSALSFALVRPLRAFGHYLAVAALGVALVALWHLLDARLDPVGYATQAVTLLLAQALMFGRIALRLALWAGQIDLLRRVAHEPVEEAAA
jgi:hypothetical protein